MKECDIHLKDPFVQVQKELYNCVSLSEFINPLAVLAPSAIDCDKSIEKLQLYLMAQI